MTDEFERMFFLRICLEGLRGTTKDLNQDGLSPDRVSQPGLHSYEVESTS